MLKDTRDAPYGPTNGVKFIPRVRLLQTEKDPSCALAASREVKRNYIMINALASRVCQVSRHEIRQTSSKNPIGFVEARTNRIRDKFADDEN